MFISVIYYEIMPDSTVEATYDLGGERIYDHFSSCYKFYTFAHTDCPDTELIRITNDNYNELSEKGVL